MTLPEKLLQAAQNLLVSLLDFSQHPRSLVLPIKPEIPGQGEPQHIVFLSSQHYQSNNLSEIDTKSEETKTAPKPTFSFAATMANLQKQKEAPAPKPETIRKPETPEEKRKRLRKEQRRKLRVSFKADGDLVQIREFVHDPEEDMGHEDSQTRDVGDSKGEGQMLKMHKDLDLMDEDEDYEPPEEMEPIPEWTIPQRELAPTIKRGLSTDEWQSPILARLRMRNARETTLLVEATWSLIVQKAKFRSNENQACLWLYIRRSLISRRHQKSLPWRTHRCE